MFEALAKPFKLQYLNCYLLLQKFSYFVNEVFLVQQNIKVVNTEFT